MTRSGIPTDRGGDAVVLPLCDSDENEAAFEARPNASPFVSFEPAAVEIVEGIVPCRRRVWEKAV